MNEKNYEGGCDQEGMTYFIDIGQKKQHAELRYAQHWQTPKYRQKRLINKFGFGNTPRNVKRVEEGRWYPVIGEVDLANATHEIIDRTWRVMTRSD